MDLSVIIPTYNRKKVLRSVVLSLINQGNLDYEIIVCDDGGDDNTFLELEDIKKNFELPFSLEYCYQERKGFRAGSARNMGARKAKADKFVFIDQDVIVSPEILQKFKDVQNGCFVCGIKRLVSLEFYNKVSDNSIVNGMEIFLSQTFGFINATLSSLGAITRHDFELVDGFDEDFVSYGLEDTELIERLRDIKIRAGTDIRCVGYHIEHDGNVVSRQIQDIYHHKRNNRTGTGKKVSCE
jgi:glycosyltransferase involved in cell wall biosynthesis